MPSTDCAMQGQHDVPFNEGASTVSGTLYLSGEEHCRLMNDVYTSFSHTNPMHADVFPSIRQMELEVLAMTASMVGGEHSAGCLQYHVCPVDSVSRCITMQALRGLQL